MPLDEFRRANRAAWDTWVDDHVASGDYGFNAVKTGGSSLTPIDLEEAGDVRGMSLLHLMCHYGTDTLSWAREGAIVTGLDFSSNAIEVARGLAAETGLDARFIECELHDAPSVLPEHFDIVYTSAGVLCWLPDIRAWARVVAGFVKPGGVFYLREIHPVLWSLAQDRGDGLMVIEDDYFETGQPRRDESIVGSESTEQTTYGWSHGLGEIVTAIIDAGLRIEFLHEQRVGGDWSFFLEMRQRDDSGWELSERRDRLPLQYSIRAIREATHVQN